MEQFLDDGGHNVRAVVYTDDVEPSHIVLIIANAYAF